MNTHTKWEVYINLIKQEVVPALGCTDPISIALAAAKAREVLQRDPERIDVSLSRNMLKNAMGVGIPGAGASGVGLAAALGAFGGNASANLEVLQGITPETVERAKQFVHARNVSISLKDASDVLYIEVTLSTGQETARAVIQGDYTRVILIERNGHPMFELNRNRVPHEQAARAASDNLTVKDLCHFITHAPFEQLQFILESARMNTTLAEEGLINDYGLRVGKMFRTNLEKGILSQDIPTLAAMQTAAAIDARMAGCALPAMTNSGSGNQGITATIPVVVAARELQCSEETLARALMLSHFITIHLRQHFDRLSAMCGAVAAGTGAACGIAYLLGGTYHEISATIANMVGNLSGVICDGAKYGCALKVSSAVQAGIQSALLAMQGMRVSKNEGIVEQDVEKTIDNLGRLSSEGMKQTDRIILEMMAAK
ncbi:UPF0597 protein Dde_0807 [Candidatus Vecturithrix granuli]|uniref:UPF0597 protein U27_04524 n=1 Tax=Vecturithrix granuli TaxID=1499967 RepID=A0A081BZ02_VECG1|nr:UPF0597 protein Dde_0807 [Candidatus Vecturithrix granuli]